MRLMTVSPTRHGAADSRADHRLKVTQDRGRLHRRSRCGNGIRRDSSTWSVRIGRHSWIYYPLRRRWELAPTAWPLQGNRRSQRSRHHRAKRQQFLRTTTRRLLHSRSFLVDSAMWHIADEVGYHREPDATNAARPTPRQLGSIDLRSSSSRDSSCRCSRRAWCPHAQPPFSSLIALDQSSTVVSMHLLLRSLRRRRRRRSCAASTQTRTSARPMSRLDASSGSEIAPRRRTGAGSRGSRTPPIRREAAFSVPVSRRLGHFGSAPGRRRRTIDCGDGLET